MQVMQQSAEATASERAGLTARTASQRSGTNSTGVKESAGPEPDADAYFRARLSGTEQDHESENGSCRVAHCHLFCDSVPLSP